MICHVSKACSNQNVATIEFVPEIRLIVVQDNAYYSTFSIYCVSREFKNLGHVFGYEDILTRQFLSFDNQIRFQLET